MAATWAQSGSQARMRYPGNDNWRSPLVDVWGNEIYSSSINLGAGFGAADIAQLFKITAGSLVLALAMREQVAEGNACTVDVGDAAQQQGFIVAASINAAAFTEYYSANPWASVLGPGAYGAPLIGANLLAAPQASPGGSYGLQGGQSYPQLTAPLFVQARYNAASVNARVKYRALIVNLFEQLN